MCVGCCTSNTDVKVEKEVWRVGCVWSVLENRIGYRSFVLIYTFIHYFTRKIVFAQTIRKNCINHRVHFNVLLKWS